MCLFFAALSAGFRLLGIPQVKGQTRFLKHLKSCLCDRYFEEFGSLQPIADCFSMAFSTLRWVRVHAFVCVYVCSCVCLHVCLLGFMFVCFLICFYTCEKE